MTVSIAISHETPAAAMMAADRRRRRLVVFGLLALIMGCAFLIRSYGLNSLPPHLWWDEATQGLDARDLLQGRFQIFFPRAEGKEPLYIYLTAPLVAVWDGEPFATRLAGALLGMLMVPVIFFTARSLWFDDDRGEWVGLIAAAFWMTSYWALSMNRLGFQVNALPLILTLAVLTWTNWSRRPNRRRAILFGLCAGLTLLTYLAARITPLLWVALYVSLPGQKRIALTKSISWAVLAFLLLVLPLGLYLVFHPDVAGTRVGVFPLLSESGDSAHWFDSLVFSLKMVAGVFLGTTGDPILRHNIPNRPPFSPVLAVLFGLGTVLSVARLFGRDQKSWTLLLWLAILSLPGVLAIASNPHFPRLFGALPAALLLAAWAASALLAPLQRFGRPGLVIAVIALVLLAGFEGARTAQAYFVTWKNMDLYPDFQGDLWTFGERVVAAENAVGVVSLPNDDALVLEYGFAKAPLLSLSDGEADVEIRLADRLKDAGGKEILLPVWLEAPYLWADPKNSVLFYLLREGRQLREEALGHHRLLTVALGPQPQFDAQGQQVVLQQPFSSGVQLVGARWGGAYPNNDRNAAQAMAGSKLWAILTWQMVNPSPDLFASVELVDEQGHRLAVSDQQMLFVDEQAPAAITGPQTIRTYHLLSLPATQPPGQVSLRAHAFDAAKNVLLVPGNREATSGVPLGTATVVAATEPTALETIAITHPMRVSYPSGVSLAGVDTYPDVVAPGQPLTLRIFWHIDEPLSQAATFTVSLGDTGLVAATSIPVGAPVGQTIHSYVDFQLPPELPSGRHALLMQPAGGQSTMTELGQVEVIGRARQFVVPALSQDLSASFGGQVRLEGMTGVPSGGYNVHPGNAVQLELVWRVRNTPAADLVRFLHVLDSDGQLVAQQDAIPCDGACPSRSWLPGEILSDRAEIVLPTDLADGAYSLVTGWYDARSQQRLPASDASGQRLDNDVAPLPVTVRVSEP